MPTEQKPKLNQTLSSLTTLCGVLRHTLEKLQSVQKPAGEAARASALQLNQVAAPEQLQPSSIEDIQPKTLPCALVATPMSENPVYVNSSDFVVTRHPSLPG